MKRTRTHEYNAETRLSAVRDGHGNLIAEYSYDPFGRRVKKTVYDPPGQNPETTWYVYSDQGLMAELDETGQETDFYLFPPDGLWSTDPILRKSGSSYFYYQTDHLGTPQQLIDGAGAVVHSREMRAFGEVAATGMEDRWRFPGQLESAETGLYYNYFRDYAPGKGRYVQSDPIGLWGGLNLHGYSMQNPAVFFDERGLWAWRWVICNSANELDDLVNHRKRRRRNWCEEDYQKNERAREEDCHQRFRLCVAGGRAAYIRQGDDFDPGSTCECRKRNERFCNKWKNRNKKRRQECIEGVGDDWWLPSIDCGPPRGQRRR